jgi:hypothetical protein
MKNFIIKFFINLLKNKLILYIIISFFLILYLYFLFNGYLIIFNVLISLVIILLIALYKFLLNYVLLKKKNIFFLEIDEKCKFIRFFTKLNEKILKKK